MKLNLKNKFLSGLIWTVGILLVFVIGAAIFMPIQEIIGHEAGISETFLGIRTVPQADGTEVAKEFAPGKRLYFRVWENYTLYDMRKHRYILDTPENVAAIDQNDINGNALYIQTDRGQTVKVRIKVIWRYKPGMLGVVHAQARNDVDVAEAKILDTPIKRISQNLITPQDALYVYYGAGLVELQKDFKSQLMEDEAIAEMGIVIDDAVVYTELDPEYVEQINAKITAEQKEKAQEQIEAANLAEAEAEKAAAEILKAKVVVAAQAEAEKAVLAAEAEAKKEVLAAEAAAKKVTLAAEADMEKERMEGEGQKLRLVAEAEGTLAMALAEAEGQEKLKMAKYDGEAGERQTSVMIAEAIAEKVTGMLDGVDVIPENAFISVVSELSQPGIQPVIDIKAGK